jgi:hypothetical protein
MGLPICHCNPYDDMNDWVDSGLATVGAEYTWEGSTFMCVYNAGSGAGVAGELVGGFLTTPAVGHITAVSTEWLDGTLSTLNIPLGMLCYASTAGRYCYILRRGWTTTNGRADGTAFLKTDGGVVKGDSLVADGGASPDGVADTAADGEEEGVFGQAWADDTAGSLVIAKVNFL